MLLKIMRFKRDGRLRKVNNIRDDFVFIHDVGIWLCETTTLRRIAIPKTCSGLVIKIYDKPAKNRFKIKVRHNLYVGDEYQCTSHNVVKELEQLYRKLLKKYDIAENVYVGFFNEDMTEQFDIIG